jgi:hypothetical protein
MATKIAPKKAIKPASKQAEGDKEKLAAQRQKLIEASAETITPLIVEADEIRKQGESKFLEISDSLKEAATENDFSSKELRQVAILAVSEARGIKSEDVSMKSDNAVGRSSYTYISKVLTLAMPKEGCQKEVDKARAKGSPIEFILKCATGNIKANAAPAKKTAGNQHTAPKKVNGKAVIEDLDTAGNELAALVSRMVQGGIDCDEIEEKFAEIMQDTRETLEASASE